MHGTDVRNTCNADRVDRAAWRAHGNSHDLAENGAERCEVACADVCRADRQDVCEGQSDKLGHKVGVSASKRNGPTLTSLKFHAPASPAAVHLSASVEYELNRADDAVVWKSSVHLLHICAEGEEPCVGAERREFRVPLSQGVGHVLYVPQGEGIELGMFEDKRQGAAAHVEHFFRGVCPI